MKTLKTAFTLLIPIRRPMISTKVLMTYWVLDQKLYPHQNPWNCTNLHMIQRGIDLSILQVILIKRKWCFERCLLKSSDLHQTFKVHRTDIFSPSRGPLGFKGRWCFGAKGSFFCECLSFICTTYHFPIYIYKIPSYIT